MNDTVYQLRKWFRRGLAGTLFTLLLLGSSVAALSAFAAGINALSGAQRMTVVASATPPVSKHSSSASDDKAAHTPSPTQSQSGTDTTSDMTTSQGVDVMDSQPSFTEQMNDKLSHMDSPIGHELDAGGVALGETVQRSFGTVLSGLVQTLLLGQPTASQSGGQP